MAAMIVVNAFGEIVDPDSGAIVAGPRGDEAGTFESTLEVMRKAPLLPPFAIDANSTIGVVVTDAVLTRDEALRMAIGGQAGLARAIAPAHTIVDGDTIFALATGRNDAETDVLQLATLAARAVERAIVNGVEAATGLAGTPSAREWAGEGR